MGRTVHVHLHRGTRDAAPDMRALYADLVERMQRALADFKARDARTGDEDKGHEFHGNQWTGGLGSKPKPTKADLSPHKGAFAKMHQVLSSGHKFTKQEMIDLCDLSGEKKLTDYLAMLKNPKYAGKHGALKIEKDKDGLYYVAMPDGSVAPPLAEPEMHVSPELAAAMKPTPAPEPAPEPSKAEKVKAPAPPPMKGKEALLAAAPGSMPKAEADAHYQHHLDAAYADLAKMAKAGIGGQVAHDEVLKFKQAKASGMAAWATAVHGHAFSPKPQAVFKADLQLVQDAKDFSKEAALNNWKANTAQEKIGNFPPKAAAVTKADTHAAAAASQQVVDMGHPAEVKPVGYDELVPAGFQGISAEDIAQGKYAKGVSKIKSDLHSKSSANAQGNKKSIEEALRDRLKDKPNFQALVKRLGLAKTGQMSLEARLISAWAGSSGDTNDISVALQLAVRDAFGIPDGHVEKKALNSLQKHGHVESAVISAGIHSLNQNMKPLKPHETATAKAALMEFVQAQYHETQDLLKEMGHDHLYLQRGMKFSTGHKAHEGPAQLKLQPASSFSTSYSTAKSFAGGGTVFLVKVPRQQVLSTYLTGFGCTGEHEVVVLAHGSMRTYSVPAGAASGHATAQEYIKGQLAPHQVAAATKAAPPVPKPTKAEAENLAAYHALQKKDAQAHLAAVHKTKVNAVSKAHKAKKAAEKYKTPDKIAHAAKAAEEAQTAVAQYKAVLKAVKGMK